MMVCVRILFNTVREKDWEAMRSLPRFLTDDPAGVRVYEDREPNWLAVEFSMPTQAQYVAVAGIVRQIECFTPDRTDSTIDFPRSEEVKARAKRKSERRKARRAELRKYHE